MGPQALSGFLSTFEAVIDLELVLVIIDTKMIHQCLTMFLVDGAVLKIIDEYCLSNIVCVVPEWNFEEYIIGPRIVPIHKYLRQNRFVLVPEVGGRELWVTINVRIN